MQKLFKTAAFRVVLLGVMLAATPLLTLSLQSNPVTPAPTLTGLQAAVAGFGLCVAAFGIGLMLGATKSVWAWLGVAVFGIASVELAYALFAEPAMRFTLVAILASSVWIGERIRRANLKSRSTTN